MVLVFGTSVFKYLDEQALDFVLFCTPIALNLWQVTIFEFCIQL